MRKISEGAESELYSTAIAGISAVVKRRLRKLYRIRQMDEQIRSERTRKEAKLMSLANKAGVLTPRILLVDRYDIVMEKIEGKTLNRMEGMTASESAKIFSAVGESLGSIHQNDVAHGDYTPANIMVDGSGVVHIIDFGLGERTVSIEDKSMDLLLMKRSISKENYRLFIAGYSRKFSRHAETVRRLATVEKRGRYNTRTIQTT